MNLAKGFSDRTVAAGNISFGLRWNNLLKVTIHWDQDFRRIGQKPSLIGFSNAAESRAAIEAAINMSSIRKIILGESTILSKAANPGKIKRQKYWITWSRALKNYLSTILGQDGVPLIYVIRECAAPEYAIELQPDYDFEQFSIYCIALT